MYNIVCVIPYEHQAVGFSVYLTGFRNASIDEKVTCSFVNSNIVSTLL